MTIKDAKEISLVDFLERLGFKGQQRGIHVWFNSPFSDEATPSFKVNTKLNKYYDWSGGERNFGNIIDFGTRYFKCDVATLLKKLDDNYPLASLAPKVKAVKPDENEQPEIKITSVKSLRSFPLFQYLKERHIPEAIADRYCKEVNYELKGKNYYAIGFKNNSGGFALRNRHMKAASTPNDLTFIDNGAKDVATFEGFFDFLSYKAIFHKQEEPNRNYLILNSSSFFEKSLPILQQHARVFGYLDNDKTGNKITSQAKEILKEKFSDERGLYLNHKDLNAFLTEFGKIDKQRLSQRF
jgi:hypothetical protein